MAEREEAPRRLALAGSTGSIGTQALDVVRAAPEAFDVVALGAASSVDLLAAQVEEFGPRVVALADAERRSELERRLPAGTELRCGAGALASLAVEADVDVVLNAVVGFAGLDVTVATLEAGKRLALANKESLIAGAPVVQRARRTPGAEILPVDSEHCAIHQCLRSAGRGEMDEVRKLVLTASGGPFRGRTAAELEDVTVADALAHPTWSMGPKITVDSSTLMNKGLEVLEANELFGVGIDRIEVVVHPQSVVHSMVEFSDGSTIAQLSRPDMRLPIGYCLSYPDRLARPFGEIDWSELASLHFEQPDLETFSCLRLAFEAGRLGGAAPAWLNAANEVAVAAFLQGAIGWRGIAAVVSDVLDTFEQTELRSIEDVLEADRSARASARAAVTARSRAA
ncbi:MAG TPA: 1-deoxy-D-xylulose-5-phosphate reductoisomerase [Acidimicrobiales bacterium]|nr:1-deoxy-D-xylulose-5-phosphate reductoisomerase [Acidimicrobiales bacterium]